MRHPIGYFLSIPIALLLLLGTRIGGVGYWIIPILSFLCTPFLERWLGTSRWPSANALKNITPGRERGYEAAPVIAGLVTLAVLARVLWLASTRSLTGWEFAGLTISTGIMTGYVGIVVAHELMHREDRPRRLLAWVLMSAAIYPHFCVEHVLGHHPRFATPADPATARRGENFYFFVPRSIVGGLISAIKLRPVPVLVAYVLIVLVLAGISAGLGPVAFKLALLQGAIAIVLLEGINYLEHYGLQRKQLANGRYEAPGPAHSWDTSVLVTNLNIFNLGRHSDHHSFSRRPYYRLRHNAEAPQLPHGYATMFLMALVPPLWFATMDRRLDEWAAQHGGDSNSPSATPAE